MDKFTHHIAQFRIDEETNIFVEKLLKERRLETRAQLMRQILKDLRSKDDLLTRSDRILDKYREESKKKLK